jgi:hypothetical protein
MDSASSQQDRQESRITAEQREILDRLAELSKVFPVGELLARERQNEHLARLEAMMLYPFVHGLGETELDAIRAAADALRAQIATQAIRKPR